MTVKRLGSTATTHSSLSRILCRFGNTEMNGRKKIFTIHQVLLLFLLSRCWVTTGCTNRMPRRKACRRRWWTMHPILLLYTHCHTRTTPIKLFQLQSGSNINFTIRRSEQDYLIFSVGVQNTTCNEEKPNPLRRENRVPLYCNVVGLPSCVLLV